MYNQTKIFLHNYCRKASVLRQQDLKKKENKISRGVIFRRFEIASEIASESEDRRKTDLVAMPELK